jgi:hypothetical protein
MFRGYFFKHSGFVAAHATPLQQSPVVSFGFLIIGDAMPGSNWIPMRWPEVWKDASALELIRGTPINCLVGTGPAPLAEAGIGYVRLREASPPDGVVVRQGLWPRVRVGRDDSGESADAGPTGAPWVDSNGWLIRMTQALNPEKAVWLNFGPPKEALPLRQDAYRLPVAEAETYGGHWVITLDTEFCKGLAARDDGAVAGWRKIVSALEFFKRHNEWKTWLPVAVLGVISDFAGPNEFLGGEFLNLAARRELAHRIVDKSRAETASFEGLKAILYIDTQPPAGELRRELLAFVNTGGLLISLRGFLTEPADKSLYGYEIHRYGSGRIAIPVKDWEDPYLLVAETHLLLSRRQDALRLWNTGSVNAHYVASPDGKKAAVELINYSGRPTPDNLTVGLAKAYRSARLLTLDGSGELTPVKRRRGIELPLPSFSVYAGIELEG